MKFCRLTRYSTTSKQSLTTFNILIPFLIAVTRVTNISSSVVNQSFVAGCVTLGREHRGFVDAHEE